jgi:hypothetical protein
MKRETLQKSATTNDKVKGKAAKEIGKRNDYCGRCSTITARRFTNAITLPLSLWVSTKLRSEANSTGRK